MANALSAPHFHDEEAAFAYVEARRLAGRSGLPALWRRRAHLPDAGQGHPQGLYKCYQCRKQFTVRREPSSRAPRSAAYLASGHFSDRRPSRRASARNQLHRILGVTLKTAWFMAHRIREAMRDGDLAPMGGAGGVVEVDETFIGRKLEAAVAALLGHKMKILGLVDRGTGRSRSFDVDRASQRNIHADRARATSSAKPTLMTDEARIYRSLGRSSRSMPRSTTA